MDPWILQPEWRARLALITLVACFYTGVVVISNELLFYWAADTTYRYWFYPPAGVRLALILLLGWPGLLGYFTAVLALVSGGIVLEDAEFYEAFWIALVRTLSIWLALIAYGAITHVKTPWEKLTWMHLPFLALFISAISGAAAHLARSALGIDALDTLVRDVSLTVFGDTLGSIVVLSLVLWMRKAYREHALKMFGAQPQHHR